MPRRLFERIEQALWRRSEFRADLKDATGKAGINPKMKIISVLRVLAYGMSFDAVDELCEIAESTTRKAFFSFIDLMKEEFGSEYLRVPNKADLQRILAINQRRGFPGCVGSWDCRHWQWKNCPIAWAGQFKGKEKKSTIVLEAI